MQNISEVRQKNGGAWRQVVWPPTPRARYSLEFIDAQMAAVWWDGLANRPDGLPNRPTE
jgi:hypothetical protein